MMVKTKPRPGVASPQPSWTPPLSRRGCISTCPFRLPLPPPPRTRRHLRIGARNVKRFRGGLVFKAHRRLYHSTLDLRVIKQRRRSYRRTRRSSGGACLLPASSLSSGRARARGAAPWRSLGPFSRWSHLALEPFVWLPRSHR